MKNDRAVNPASCEAYGCSLLGIFSASTTGNHHWYCFLHYGASDFQRITAIIHRHGWLADTITTLRTNYARQSWGSTFRAAQQRLLDHERQDLQWSQEEPVWAWIRRLEAALEAFIIDKEMQHEKAQALRITTSQAGTLARQYAPAHLLAGRQEGGANGEPEQAGSEAPAGGAELAG